MVAVVHDDNILPLRLCWRTEAQQEEYENENPAPAGERKNLTSHFVTPTIKVNNQGIVTD